MLRICDVLKKTTDFFAEKGIDTPRLDAEILLAWSLGVERLKLFMDFQRPLNPGELEAYRVAIRRRVDREPVAYITGKREFLGWDFAVDKNVLIPRPETELLVEIVAGHLEKLAPKPVRKSRRIESPEFAEEGDGAGTEEVEPAIIYAEDSEAPEEIPQEQVAEETGDNEPDESGTCYEPLFADVGAGSGIIGICLAKMSPASRGMLCDISPDALSVTKINIERHGLSDRLTVSEGDLLGPVGDFVAETGPLDALASNPPYISENEYQGLEPELTRHEPKTALVADEGGLALIARLIDGAKPLLKPGGMLAMEIGAGQAAAVVQMMERAGWRDIETHRDLAKHERVVSALA